MSGSSPTITSSARGNLGGRATLVASIALFAIPAGCETKDRKYQIKSGERVVSLAGEDLGIGSPAFNRMGYHFLRPEPSFGLFPTGLCVLRVEAFVDSARAQRFLRVQPVPGHHAVYWNHLFDTLAGIREVVFLSRPHLDPRGYDFRAVIDAATGLNCGLALIYSRVHQSDADAEYAGVLWNVERREPLVSFRTPIVLPPELVKELEENPESDVAIREADFRAEQEFRNLVQGVIWDMAKRDATAPKKRSNPWRGYIPNIPRGFEFLFDPRYEYWRKRLSNEPEPADEVDRTNGAAGASSPSGAAEDADAGAAPPDAAPSQDDAPEPPPTDVDRFDYSDFSTDRPAASDDGDESSRDEPPG